MIHIKMKPGGGNQIPHRGDIRRFFLLMRTALIITNQGLTQDFDAFCNIGVNPHFNRWVRGGKNLKTKTTTNRAFRLFPLAVVFSAVILFA